MNGKSHCRMNMMMDYSITMVVFTNFYCTKQFLNIQIIFLQNIFMYEVGKCPLQRSYARSCSLLPVISKCYKSETTNLSQLNGHECRASVKICLVCKKQTFHNGTAKQGKRMCFISLNFHPCTCTWIKIDTLTKHIRKKIYLL